MGILSHTKRHRFVLFIVGLSFQWLLFAGEQTKLSALKDQSFMKYLLIHPLHRIEATSKELQCTIGYDDATKTIVSASFSAEVSSFDSGNSNRDSHAMEVLDALTYPTVSFESKNIAATGAELQVSGDLSFHGITKPITLTASTSSSADSLTVQGNADVSLTSFNIDRPSLLMIPVEDTLGISFTMVFLHYNK